MSIEEVCREKAKRRYEEYESGKFVVVRRMFIQDDGFELKKGDILRIGDGSSCRIDLLNIEQQFWHYLIYEGPGGNEDGFQYDWVIHKVNTKQDDGEYIKRSRMTREVLMTYWIHTTSRYESTYDLAFHIFKEKKDLGFSVTHSNCEHFVTYCLTGHNYYSRSRQWDVRRPIRNSPAIVYNGLSSLTKLTTHLVYRLAGSMTLTQRIIKSKLPFGLDSDEDAIRISNGQKVLIGHGICNPCESWYVHPYNIMSRAG